MLEPGRVDVRFILGVHPLGPSPATSTAIDIARSTVGYVSLPLNVDLSKGSKNGDEGKDRQVPSVSALLLSRKLLNHDEGRKDRLDPPMYELHWIYECRAPYRAGSDKWTRGNDGWRRKDGEDNASICTDGRSWSRLHRLQSRNARKKKRKGVEREMCGAGRSFDAMAERKQGWL